MVGGGGKGGWFAGCSFSLVSVVLFKCCSSARGAPGGRGKNTEPIEKGEERENLFVLFRSVSSALQPAGNYITERPLFNHDRRAGKAFPRIPVIFWTEAGPEKHGNPPLAFSCTFAWNLGSPASRSPHYSAHGTRIVIFLPVITSHCALIAFSKKALSKLRKESSPRAASFQCSTSQGAGTQHPIHFSCAPARSHTITASSKASATKQLQ